MVMATVFNKSGNSEDFRKPCFGFLSYIDQWEDDEEEWDEDDEEYVNTPKCGFNSGDLDYMIWDPHWRDMSSVSNKVVQEALPAIFAAYPQLFGNFVYQPEQDHSIRIPLQGANMQSTVFACMMLRNVLEYSSYRLVFDTLVGAEIPVEKAFLLSTFMSGGYNVSFGGNMFYWSQGGDDQIMGDEIRLIDIKNIVDGGLGHIYQGVFGDTENGYGRYGSYDNNSAPRATRQPTNSNRRLTLTDTLVMEKTEANAEEIEKSPYLTSILAGVKSTMRLNDAEMLEFSRDLLSKLQE